MPSRSPRRPARLLAALARVVVLAAWGLLVAEVFIRLVHPQPRMPRYTTGTPWGVRGNIPNANYRHSTAEVDVGFHINAQGMRADRDFAQAKPPGTCRIAVLGDSFMMGYELDLADTFAERLEKGLRAAGRRVDVLNFAVSGFGTAESLRAYEAYATRFSPDVVIMEWDRSDYDDNVRADLYRLDGAAPVATGNTFLPSVGVQERLMANPAYRWVADHSDLFNFAREYLGLQARNVTARLSGLRASVRAWLRPDRPGAIAAGVTAEPAAVAGAAPWAGSISPGSIALSAALLNKAQAMVTAAGRTFLVVEIPYQYPHQHSVSSMSLMGQGVLDTLPVVSPVAAFNAASPSRKMFYDYGDGHITPDAVGLMLAPVLERLKADPHLAGCRAT